MRLFGFLASVVLAATISALTRSPGVPSDLRPSPAPMTSGTFDLQGSWPQTRAESTNYAETSHYDDVIAFLDALRAKNPPMRFETIGRSTEGKDMRLVVVAKDPKITPREARERGLIVAYIQANIHAGEVEGKEAALMLLRELARNPSHPLLDRMVLLVTPIYNIDGNERFGPANRNRPSQDGPDPVGERANGAGLDLNRDCMKAESPEMRAVLEHVYVKWDPDVMMDLHTTNGTRHGYVLTYSPPLNPTTDEGILRFTRDQLLPKVRREFPKKHGGWLLFDYGNVEGSGDQRRWATFEEKPRYVTNYAGIRNRVAVLSEAASFQPFKVRVESTLAFVKEVLSECAAQKDKIRRLVKEADARIIAWGKDPTKAPEIGIRFDFDQRGKEAIPLEKPNATDPVAHNKAPKYLENVELPVLDRFKAIRTAKPPRAYLIPADYPQVARLLMRHGVEVERLVGDYPPALGEVGWRRFFVTEATAGRQAFQGHRLVTLEGKWDMAHVSLKRGDFFVSTNQPLGLLIFHMLEPESLDGAAAWGFLGDSFEKGKPFPIVKMVN